MLDKLEKTHELLTALEVALPFEVELTPALIACLRRQHVARAVNTREIVSKISYFGDEGGIMCHIVSDTGEALIVSLTHVTVRRTSPFAEAVYAYQKHRVKKLKKLNSA